MRSRPSRRRPGGSRPSCPSGHSPGSAGRTLAATKLTLRDVAEDSLTALVFGAGETDRARGGGLRAGHYSIGSDGTLELDGVRSCRA